MPLRNEQPSISMAGTTASVSISGCNGVCVHVSVRAPDGAGRLGEEELERRILRDTAAALRSALWQIDPEAKPADELPMGHRLVL
jgi:hypothetical protein